MHSPGSKKNSMSTSEMTEEQRQVYTEKLLSFDPLKMPAAVCEIIADRKDCSSTALCLLYGHNYFSVFVFVTEIICSGSTKAR